MEPQACCVSQTSSEIGPALVRKAAAVESINQEHRASFFSRQAVEPVMISNKRMREMLDELFD